MSALAMAMRPAAALTLILLLASGCPRDLCDGGGCGDGGGEEPTDGCVRLGGACGTGSCCAADSAGNALSCDADAGSICRTTCGQLASSCGAAAPCCAGSSGGYSLGCVQDACAQCIGLGMSCDYAEVECCPGTTCQASGGYTYYTCQ